MNNYKSSNISNQFDSPGRRGLHPHVMRSTPEIESKQDPGAYEKRSELFRIMNGDLNPNLSKNKEKGILDKVIDYAVSNPIVSLIGISAIGFALSKIGSSNEQEEEVFEIPEVRRSNPQSQTQPQIIIVNGSPTSGTPQIISGNNGILPASAVEEKKAVAKSSKDTQMDCGEKQERKKPELSLKERIRRSKTAKKQKRRKDGTFAKGKKK